MNDEDLARTQAQLDDALARLEALVRECQGLFARTRVLAGLPPLDAVDHLLQRLGDEGPVDDFEAGRRRDRRLLPRHERRPRHQ
jgi:outer membrane protein TolC